MSKVSRTDNYQSALIAVSAALDALYDDKADAATTIDPAADDYDPLAHHRAFGAARGVADALAVVTGMLDNYRRVSA